MGARVRCCRSRCATASPWDNYAGPKVKTDRPLGRAHAVEGGTVSCAEGYLVTGLLRAMIRRDL